MRLALLSICSLLLLCPAHALRAQAGPVVLPRLDGPIELDGRPDEASWQAINVLPLTMYTPLHRGAVTESTEIRVAHDDSYLYASGRLYDSDAAGIRVNSLNRDRWSGDDLFTLVVDSFNDNQSARRFSITPAGTRIDELIGSDGADRNLSWDARWDVATARDERGWYFEMRIPFASLRFQGRGAEVVMGLSASRLVARKNERTTWPDVDPQSAFDRPSVAADVILRDIRPARPVLVTPYALGGAARGPDVPGAEYRGVRDAGVDVKYSVTDNLFVDLSINTDFAQVEADDQQINLTRFPLFFPEKRQFFQERSDLFLFDFGNGGRLFHSRTIGLSDAAQPVRILGGVRVAGSANGWDFGLLDMQSDAHDGRPGENFGVGRVRRRIINPFSYAGAMVTSRIATDGHRSIAGGADASVRLRNQHYATARVAVTDDGAAGSTIAARSQLYLEWARRAERGLTYWLRLNRIGDAYDPGVGFLPRQGDTHASLYGVYATRGQQGDLFRTFGPGVIVNAWYGNDSRALETLYAAHWWNYALWNGASGWLQVTRRMDQLVEPLGVGDGVTIPAGDHYSTNLWFYYASGPSSRLRTAVSARAGGFYDGRQVELIARPTWNISRHFEIGGDAEASFLRFDDRADAVNVYVARLRLRAAASARLSAAALVQYNSVADVLGVNVRLRYNAREGTDVWLVYDEGLNTERSVDGTPDVLPRSTSRSVRAKVTYTFGM